MPIVKRYLMLICIIIFLLFPGCGGSTTDKNDDNSNSEQNCPTAADCPCDGPSDCPDHWLCVIFAEGDGSFCVEASGNECEQQSDCEGTVSSCQGLDCSDGRGASGCGFGVCLDSIGINCSRQLDCPSQYDYCVNPGVISNSACYQEQ